ncbi:MAG: bifunctional allantoicase/(S)-ureidoglycine aminohydrolase [Hyphomicrobiales bacterium]
MFNKAPQYYAPNGDMPDQRQIMTDRAVFTDAYAVIPKGVMTDIVTSFIPHWKNSRFWVIARPLSGFAETFSHYIAEIAPEGGSVQPENDDSVESVIFVVAGSIDLTIDDKMHKLDVGGYAFLPPKCDWQLHNSSSANANFHWIRKRYVAADGIDMPTAFVTSDQEVSPMEMPNTDGTWATTRFAEPTDLRHDMHVNIVSFKPGGNIPFAETHVMEHGLYVLQGKAVYRLNQDWVEVEAGDYMWLRAFCPQACVAAGPEPFRYLLYKDVNRHMSFDIKSGK